jgi:hypothetical protein
MVLMMIVRGRSSGAAEAGGSRLPLIIFMDWLLSCINHINYIILSFHNSGADASMHARSNLKHIASE